MNNRRKLIFKEALFNVPFLLLISVLTFAFMFFSGRSAFDVEQLVKHNRHSDPTVNITGFLTTELKAYKIEYYYGDKNDIFKYADFEYKGKGDSPESILTLYETRNGFAPGVYSTVKFFNEEYVTYMPLNSSSDGSSFEKYLTSEVPTMYELVTSYSWEGAMIACGAADGNTNGYKISGLRLFIWDQADNGIIRENFLWTIGGNAEQMYSYLPGDQGEYKKIVFKK